MAIPTPFLKPADNGSSQESPGKKPSKKPKKVTGPTTSPVNPTVIGVLLSVFAHGLFIAFGPRTDFSFAALTEAAQQQDAKETIVPLVEISPADRSRLPGFAQPRRLSTPPSGLNGLALNPGVGFPNTYSRGATPPSGTASRGQTQARSIPSTTSRTQNRRPLSSSTTSRTLSPFNFGTRPTPTRGTAAATRPSGTTTVLPSDLLSGQPGEDGNSPLNLPRGNRTGLGTQNGAPNPPGTRSSSSDSQAGSTQDLLTRQIEAAQIGNNPNTPATDPNLEIARNNPEPNPETGEEEGENIPIDPPVVDIAAAQTDAPRLLESFIFDDRETTPDEAEGNLATWLADTAEDTTDIESATANVEIDSKFKVCKDDPPNQGLIGVLVNPDGSQEQARVLRSIGYDILNRQALSAVEYKDFGQPAQTTQYQVTIDVIYEPEGCVKELPDVE